MDDRQPTRWPAALRGAVSAALVFHMVAVVAMALAAAPSSPLERAVADKFVPYCNVIDQGHAHRYYVDSPPTPIVTARLRFADGRPDQVVRLPDRAARPRLLYQRQLALAYHLFLDVEQARAAGMPRSESLWARSYARHLCRVTPGCSGVTLHFQMHMVPALHELHDLAEQAGGQPVDLDAEAFYTPPERIGDYPCEDF
jgi:hypothetical protein